MEESLLIKNGLLLTMDPKRRTIDHGAVTIEKNRIVAVGKTDEIEKKHKGDIVIDAKNKAVMPGLVDLHYHTALSRGVSDDLPLGEWLLKFWYPKVKAMTPHEAKAAATLSYSESVKSGTTCVNDMYFHMIECAEAAEKVGIRAVLSCDVADESEKLETIKDNERLIREKKQAANGRIQTRFGIEWMPIISVDNLLRIRDLADKYGVGIHVHLNESMDENELTKKRHGKRPVELAYDTGILGADCVGAHCVWLSFREMKMLADTGTTVSHNPSSNAKLGSGVAPIPELLGMGVNVGIGHDASTCNNNADLFEVMKWSSLIHRANRADPSLMPATKVLEMATLNGAKGLGLQKEIGSIEVGRKADLILVNLRSLHLTPLLEGKESNLFSHLVYSAHGEDVKTTIIDGKIVMENRVLKTVDEEETIERANKACADVISRIAKGDSSRQAENS